MAIQMEQVLFLLLSLCASLTVGDHAPPFKPLHPSAYTKSPLMYPSFVPKHGIALKPYMTQFRAGTRLAPVAIRPAPSMIMSLKRPIKSILSHPSLMKQPLLKRPPPPPLAFAAASIKHHKFHSSPLGPSTGEIVFEKLKPITTKLTSHKDGAIHTIPAPNLGLTKPPKAPNQIRVTSYEDSNKLEIEVKTTKPTFTAKPAFLNLSPTPSPAVGTYAHHHAIGGHQHQYQVTEEHSNDVTIGDLYSGHKTYFAPDPDPSLPSKTLVPTSDPLSIPSNGKFATSVLLQSPVAHYPLQPQTGASAVIQYVNAVPQASYAIPLATQPQLQQHILQQTAMLQEMPVSLYNPTYLVTQSNNLYNNHQQQASVNLFKPDTNFLGTIQHHQQQQEHQHSSRYTCKHKHKPLPYLRPCCSTLTTRTSTPNRQPILSATQDQLHELQSVVNQIQLNDIHNQHSADMPTYAQLVGHEQPAIHQQQLPQLNQLEQQLQQQLIQQHQQAEKGNPQRQMTEAEIANLLNYGMINLHNNLAPSDYYHYQEKQGTGGGAAQQYQQHHAAIGSTVEPQSTQSPLRIYVPDGEHEYSNNINAQKRMDEIDFEYADADTLDQGAEDTSPATNAHARSDETSTPSTYDDNNTTTNAYYDERTADDDGNEDGNHEYYDQNLSNHRLE
uniref:Uncharacterized protein n=1 Tax=Anopheles christyi TaxID=43041 RepID=A0A182JUP2_9DIPT